MSDWIWRNRNKVSWAAIVICAPLAAGALLYGNGIFSAVAAGVCLFAVGINARNIYEDRRMRRKYGSAWE